MCRLSTVLKTFLLFLKQRGLCRARYRKPNQWAIEHYGENTLPSFFSLDPQKYDSMFQDEVKMLLQKKFKLLEIYMFSIYNARLFSPNTVQVENKSFSLSWNQQNNCIKAEPIPKKSRWQFS